MSANGIESLVVVTSTSPPLADGVLLTDSGKLWH